MSRPLWTLAEIIEATGGVLDASPSNVHADAGRSVTGVSIDTRSLEPGDLFVPLTDVRDGHEFVSAAFGRGAAAALVRKDYARRPGDGVLIRVDDPLAALGRLGIAARQRLTASARVIAVTGSAGKTGTKEMLRACLQTCASSPGKVHAPEKSYNNHWGVPLTLARMPAGTEFGVFEIGMNHAGEIRPLVQMVRPHVAIVTNVLPVHVGNFADGETGVANAKAEIFEGLVGSPVPGASGSPLSRAAEPGGEGASDLRARGVTPPLTPPRPGEGNLSEEAAGPPSTAIILYDSPHYERLRAAAEARGAKVLTFGRRDGSDVRLETIASSQADAGRQSVVARLTAGNRRIAFEQAMIGNHLAVNALAVVAALETLGCDVERAVPALGAIGSAAGRGARQMLGSGAGAILLLDESYNANPASMMAALANLAATDPSGRRIAVMGDMLELGADSVRYHLGLKDAAGKADRVYCCGPSMKHLFDSLPTDRQGAWTATSTELIAAVVQELGAGDAVMVKGSLGSRMAPIVDAIKKRFAGA